MRKSLALAFLCALAVAGAGLFLIMRAPAVSPPPSATATSTARAIPDGMREYQSNTYHFSLLYPDSLSVKSYAEGGGAATFTFENPHEGVGFQMFVVPYAGAQVSPERFKEDDPSGVQQELTSVVIDGATGAAFYSTDALLGATREVWFIHGGYLYEVTTLKPLEAWLLPILQTWLFI